MNPRALKALAKIGHFGAMEEHLGLKVAKVGRSL